MLDHDRCGGNHSLSEGGEFGVGHVAEPFRNRVGRKMKVQGLRRAIAAAKRVESAWLSRVSSTRVSTAKPENLRASITRLPTVRRSAPAEPPVLGANSGGFFGRPPGFPLRPFTNQPLPVRFTAHFQPVFKPRSQILNLRRPDMVSSALLRCTEVSPPTVELGHSRLGGASWRSSHVRNAPLATVGLKKAACREGPESEVASAIRSPYRRGPTKTQAP